MAVIGLALLDTLTSEALATVRASLDASSSPCNVSPETIAFVLRQYVRTGRDDLRDAAGSALARALHDVAAPARPHGDDASWLDLFSDAASISDDERLGGSIQILVGALRAAWPATGVVSDACRGVGAILKAARDAPEADPSLARTIDEMERIVACVYEPGAGVVHEIGRDGGAGTLADHASMAAALLHAHDATARVPYAMLADELIQHAMRQWFDPEAGWRASFLDACDASRTLCRLGAVYRDEEYRRVAILADIDYALAAGRALAALEPSRRGAGEKSLYGLAVLELLAIQSAF